MYYQRQDYEDLSHLLHRFYRNMALVWLPLLAMVVAACIFRVSVIGYIGAIAMALTGTIGWYAVGYRIHSYRRLVADVLNGQQREVIGTVISTSGPRISRDGSVFIPIDLMAEDTERVKGYERTVFFDSLKGEPPVKPEQRVHIILYDNIVKGVEVLE